MFPGLHPGEKVAYQMAASGEQVTYQALNDKSNQAAQLFRRQGLQAGDGIAILLDNDVSYLQICWAAQRSGLYFTPLSTLFQAAEIEYILDNSDARLLVTSSRHLASLGQLPANLQVYLVDGDAPWPSWDAALAAEPAVPIKDECEGAEMIY